MKIFNLFKKENRAGLENPQVPVTAAALVSSSGGSTGSVYGSLNETTALGVSAVFAAVRVIAESIATVERGVYEIDSAGNKIAAREKSEFDLLTRNPNPYMSATTFYELAMYSLLLRGNFFCHIQRNIAGNVVGLVPLPADKIKIFLQGNEKSYVFEHRDMSGTGEQVSIPDSDMLHILGLTRDGIVGMTPITFMRNSVGLAVSAEEWHSRWYFQGVRPSIVLSSKASLTDDNRKQLSEGIKAFHSGLSGLGRVMLLPEGIEPVKVQLDPLDAEVLKIREFQIDEICRWFRLDPSRIQVFQKVASGAAVLGAMQFVQDSVVPWVVKIETEIDRKILKGKNLKFSFNLSSLYRGDVQSQVTMLVQEHQQGIITGNEFRQAIGMPVVDVPELNMFTLPLATQNAKTLTLPPEPKPEPAKPEPAPKPELKPEAEVPGTARNWLASELKRIHRRHLGRVKSAIRQGKEIGQAILDDLETSHDQAGPAMEAARSCDAVKDLVEREIKHFGSCQTLDDVEMQEIVFHVENN